MATQEDRQWIDLVQSLIMQDPLPVGYELENALAELSAVCLVEENVPFVLESPGLVETLLHLAETRAPDRYANLSLTNICNLAIFPNTHATLLQHDVLTIALQILKFLREGCSDEDMDFGLCAAFLICRVVGREESGPGPVAIKGNPLVIEKLEWVLTEVINAGPDGVVIGSMWNPANIMLDVATLATSDRNKPLMVRFVPLIVRALRERGHDNFRLIKFSAQALSQLVFHPQGKSDMIKQKQDIAEGLLQVSAFPAEREFDEVNKEIQVLLASLDENETVARRRSSAAVHTLQSATAKGNWKKLFGAAKAQTSAKKQHVMISYNWGCQPTAIALEKKLAAAGNKTWFDLHDMGANINDSMAEAIENSWLIISLVSRKYKESGNCRKELEMADNLQKQIIYVKVEEEFTPEGWLALVMGKALWIACFSEDAVDAAWPQIDRRVKLAAAPSSKPEPVAAVVVAPATPTKAAVSNDQIATLVAMMQAMQADNAELKAQVSLLHEKIDAMSSRLQ